MNNTHHPSSNEEVELNITPIIDCFTVLITFILASASFISIGFFEASTPGPGDYSESKQTDIDATVRIHNNGAIELKWSGKKNGNIRIDSIHKESGKKITEAIENLKKEKLSISAVMISASDQSDYGELAAVLSAIDQSGIPAVVGDIQ